MAGFVALRAKSGRTSRVLARACAVLGFAMLAACASVPSQEMSDARRAIDAARDAHAQELAPASLRRADSALDSATLALRSGNYEDARNLARLARDEAILSRELASRVAAAVQGIDAARTAGRPWQGAASLLREAEAVSTAGDTARAVQMAARAMELLR